MRMSKKHQHIIETLAEEFDQLNRQRSELERKNRELKKRLKALECGIQEFIGAADAVDIPIVTRIGKFFITQIKKHRKVQSYEYDFIEFKVINSEAHPD